MIAETGTGLFRSLFCRSLEGDPHRRGDSALRQELLADLPKITDRQGEYQPVYGLGSEYESSPRLQNLLFDCTQVTQFFAAVEEKRQIRLLDVGCNIGYTALKLAEVFPNIVGVDLDSVNIDFATRLSAYTGSSARFECLDFLKAYDSGTLDFINVDCILLFNVAHQFVFTRGIEYTKELIRAITEQVDVTFFELAHKHEYASHQKDHLLPDNPEILLSNCRSVEIEVLKTEGRPLIRVARKHACFGPISMQVGRTRFSNNPNHSISRKYYENTTQFLKLFRFTPTQSAKEWGQELRALLAIRDSGLAPTIREFAIERDFAAILMEKLDGAVLTEEYARFSEPESLRTFLAKYLAIAAKLGEAGLFHNDLSAHNLWVLRDDRLVAIDFEQADERSFIDPFAVMLWTIYDILKKRNFSYDRGIYKRLYNDMGIERADKSYYPDFSAFSLPLWLSNVIARAETSLSWFDFLRREPLAKIDNVAITPRVDSNIASPQASPAEDVEAPGSPSFVADIVRASFCAVLGRPPGPGGLSAYSKLFENVPVAVGVERAVQGLLNSDEFQTRRASEARSSGDQAASTRIGAVAPCENALDLVVLQTTDATKYFAIWEATSKTVRRYCERHSLKYETYIGVKRGFWPWQATFNRILMLKELLERGFRGWALYLDADAYIVDFEFDLREWLKDKRDMAAIFVPSGVTENAWDVNAGVIIINFGHPAGSELIKVWSTMFEGISESLLRSLEESDSLQPNNFSIGDQQMLHQILRDNERVAPWVYLASPTLMNSDAASFIRQHLAARTPNLAERTAAIREAVGQIMEGV